MTISQVAKKHGLSTDTLRYYERIGLLPSINRNKSGNRDYTEAQDNWVGFIKCMRSAGLSIENLTEYVNLFKQGSETVSLRKELLIEQRQRIAEKVAELNDTLSYLDKKINNYEDTILLFEGKFE